MNIKGILKALLLIISIILIGYFGTNKEEIIDVIQESDEIVDVAKTLNLIKPMSTLTGAINSGVVYSHIDNKGNETIVIEEVKKDDCSIAVVTGIQVCASFKQSFIDNYEYEDSRGYNFALQIKEINPDNVMGGFVGYYNVFRNDAGGVSNSVKDGLTGAIPAYKFNGSGYCRNIPLGERINVSRQKGEFGYKHEYLTTTQNNYQFELSPVKELSSDQIFNITKEESREFICN